MKRKCSQSSSLIFLALCLALTSPVAFADSGGPVVGLEAWTVQHPELSGGRGMSDSLMHFLLPQVQKCGGKITEWARRQDVVNEVEFQQSEYVDKSTAAEPGQLLQPDIIISGSLVGDAESFNWDVQVKSAMTGEVIASDQGKAPSSEMFNFAKAIADNIAPKICKQPAGYKISGRMDDGTVSGVICGSLDKPFTAVSPEVAGKWNFSPSSTAAGNFSYKAANVGGVPGSGGGTYRILKNGDEVKGIKLSGRGAIHSPLGTFSAAIGETLTLTPIRTCGRLGRT